MPPGQIEGYVSIPDEKLGVLVQPQGRTFRDVRTRFEGFAFEPLGWSAAEIAANVEAKSRQYGELIKRANIALD